MPFDDDEMYGYEDEEDLDGLGRRRPRRRRRAGRRRRRRGPGIVPPGRRRTRMQRYMLPSGKIVCPGPGDLIHISDEPIYDKFFFTDLSALVNPIVFFNTRIRAGNPSLTNILQVSELTYDVDIEAMAVIFYPQDQATAAENKVVQQFYELVQRGTLLFNIQQKNNYVFPIIDCPAGSGLGLKVFTTETDTRVLSVQNGDPAKGRRLLPHPLALRKNTKFNVELWFDAPDFAAMQAFTDPTLRIGIGVSLYGPEGQPLVPAAAGGVMQPQGIMQAAKVRG